MHILIVLVVFAFALSIVLGISSILGVIAAFAWNHTAHIHGLPPINWFTAAAVIFVLRAVFGGSISFKKKED